MIWSSPPTAGSSSLIQAPTIRPNQIRATFMPLHRMAPQKSSSHFLSLSSRTASSWSPTGRSYGTPCGSPIQVFSPTARNPHPPASCGAFTCRGGAQKLTWVTFKFLEARGHVAGSAAEPAEIRPLPRSAARFVAGCPPGRTSCGKAVLRRSARACGAPRIPGTVKTVQPFFRRRTPSTVIASCRGRSVSDSVPWGQSQPQTGVEAAISP